MPVLDATRISDETELDQPEGDHAEQVEAAEAAAEMINESDDFRCLTLDIPKQHLTTVILNVLRLHLDGEPAPKFYAGFGIDRLYDTNPHEALAVVDPNTLQSQYAAKDNIGESILDAADLAMRWIEHNSDDKDANAEGCLDFIDAWLTHFEATTVTDDIFDAIIPLDTPLDAPNELPDSTEAIDTTAAPTAATLPNPYITEEAQREFDSRKHALEERYAELGMQVDNLKNRQKATKEIMEAVLEELQEHIDRGPVKTFPSDAIAKTTPAASNEEPTATDDDDESWRAVTVEDAGFDDKICKIFREDNDIANIGQLEQFTRDNTLTDLKKVGKAKAQKIQETLDAFWTSH